MVGIDFIEEIIKEAKLHEAKGDYLLAYRTYKNAEDTAENDIDNLIDSGFNPTEYAEVQDYARARRHRVWWRLSDDEKKVTNDKMQTDDYIFKNGIFHIENNVLVRCSPYVEDYVRCFGEQWKTVDYDPDFGETKGLAYDVTIPEGVVEIGDEAFKGCCNIETIIITKSVRKIGARVFSECDLLYHVIVLGERVVFSPDTFEDSDVYTLELSLNYKYYNTQIGIINHSRSESDPIIWNHVLSPKELKKKEKDDRYKQMEYVSFYSSFLSSVLGRESYNNLSSSARPIVIIGSCILIVAVLLSLGVYSSFIRWVLNLITGTSLLFIAYLAALLLLLDAKIGIDNSSKKIKLFPLRAPKRIAENLSTVISLILLILGITAVIVSNNYRKQYAFDCTTFYVDTENGIYHLDWNRGCEKAKEANCLEEMKGYEFRKLEYSLCEECEEYEEDVRDTNMSFRYYRK